MYSYTPLKLQGSEAPSWFAIRPCWCLFLCIAVLLLVVVVLWFVVPAVLFLPDAVVNTPCGQSTGYVDNATHVYIFKGVQYGRAPVGEWRWKPPQAPSTHTCRNLNAQPPPCAQTDPTNSSKVFGSEDCLFLNVYSPHISPWVAAPVLVWIHGGDFMAGSISDPAANPPPSLAQVLGSVVVAVQYRLGAFGWLVSRHLPQSDGYHGNYALLDQILALHWIQENIHSFGGDPDQVTVMGYDAGASSALLLSSSPLARGLFHRIVSLSARPGFKPAQYDRAEQQNDGLVEGAGCGDRKCLIALSTQDVLNMVHPGWNEGFWKYDIPTVDDVTQPQTPYLAVMDGVTLPYSNSSEQRTVLASDVPILLGTAAQEVGVLHISSSTPMADWTTDDLINYLDEKLKTFQNPALNGTQIFRLYASGRDAQNLSHFNVTKLLSMILTDTHVFCSTRDIVLEAMTQMKSSIYQYVLSAMMSSSDNSYAYYYPQTFAFEALDISALLGPSDYKVGDNFQEVLKVFVHTGQVDWKPVPEEIRLIGNVMETVPNYHRDQCEYWRKYGVLNTGENMVY